MGEYKQPLRSEITTVFMYASDNTSDLFSNLRPTIVINKDRTPYAVFNLKLRETAQIAKDVTLRYGFLDIHDNYFVDGTMMVHFEPGMNLFGLAFDMTGDEPGLYRVKFSISGTDDPGIVFTFALINDELYNKELPIKNFTYPEQMAELPEVINNVELHATADQYNFWNAELMTNAEVVMENYPFVMFNIFLKEAYTEDKNIVLRTILRDTYGNVTLDEDVVFEVHNGYDRFAKSVCLKGSNNSEFYTGKYFAEFSIDNGKPFIMDFNIVSAEKNKADQETAETIRRSLEEKARQKQAEKSNTVIQPQGGIVQNSPNSPTANPAPTGSKIDNFVDKVGDFVDKANDYTDKVTKGLMDFAEKADKVLAPIQAVAVLSFGICDMLAQAFDLGSISDEIPDNLKAKEQKQTEYQRSYFDPSPAYFNQDKTVFYRVFDKPPLDLIDENNGRGIGDLFSPDYGKNICVYKGWLSSSGPVLILTDNVLYEARFGVPREPVFIIKGEYIYHAKDAYLSEGGPIYWINGNNICEMYYSSKLSSVAYFFDDKYIYRTRPESNMIGCKLIGDIIFTIN